MPTIPGSRDCLLDLPLLLLGGDDVLQPPAQQHLLVNVKYYRNKVNTNVYTYHTVAMVSITNSWQLAIYGCMAIRLRNLRNSVYSEIVITAYILVMNRFKQCNCGAYKY